MLDKNAKLDVVVLAAFVSVGSSPVKHVRDINTYCLKLCMCLSAYLDFRLDVFCWLFDYCYIAFHSSTK